MVIGGPCFTVSNNAARAAPDQLRSDASIIAKRIFMIFDFARSRMREVRAIIDVASSIWKT